MTAPNINAEAADLLDAAALRIERYGHCKGAFYPQPSADPFTSPCCADGAIRLSAGVDPYRKRINQPILNAARALSEQIGTALISHWNDEPERTKGEVIGALREAARKARAS